MSSLDVERLPGPRGIPAKCKHCRRPVFLRAESWTHVGGGVMGQRPGLRWCDANGVVHRCAK